MKKISLGKNIQDVRISRGMKQSELAERIGVSTKYISNLESGHRVPSVGTLIEIADALTINADALFMGCLKETGRSKESFLTDRISKLPCEERERILEVVEAMVVAAEKRSPQ